MNIAFRQMTAWRNNYKVIGAFMLSLGFCFITTSRYLGFADAIGSSVQATEAYIIIGSSTTYFSGILLGGLLLLSDAPFINARSTYEIIRIGKRNWFKGQILYTFFSAVVYLVITSLFSFAIVTASGRAYFTDSWSNAISILANSTPQFAISEFKLFSRMQVCWKH